MLYISKAKEAYKKGNFDEALHLYEKSLTEYPELGSTLKQTIKLLFKEKTTQYIEIIIPVFNAPKYTSRCIKSILSSKSNVEYKIIIIDDYSNEETKDILNKYQNDERFLILKNKENKGYTKSVNIGIKNSKSPFLVVLNSDTEVADYWLDRLLKCITLNDDIGIVGPLSNAASWQSVPEVKKSGTFHINQIPYGYTLNSLNKILENKSLKIYPEIPIVNGFCYMLKRKVIERIGLLDEKSFPRGYGEENDFCLRALKNNFKILLCDDLYIYHAKTKSFNPIAKKELSKVGKDNLIKKIGEKLFKETVLKLQSSKELEEIRRNFKKVFYENKKSISEIKNLKKIAFYLPCSGNGGGVHSVIQEALSLRALNVSIKVLINEKHLNQFKENYPNENILDLVIPTNINNFETYAKDFDVLIATIFTSAKPVSDLNKKYPWIMPAYYIQDYEPLFFKKDSDNYIEAYNSYNLNSSMICFAKTDWICETVEMNHNTKVFRVKASLDRSIYKTNLIKNKDNKVPIICAMIRPKTPRRGASRTMNLLAKLKEELGNKIKIIIFGSNENSQLFLDLNRNFEFENRGIIIREEVANILQSASIFIDLSDYQAFGRTGLESMSCGCIPILPIKGGCHEYAIDNFNSLLINTIDWESSLERILDLIKNQDKLINMRYSAIETSSNYSREKAAISEFVLLSEKFRIHKDKYDKNSKV